MDTTDAITLGLLLGIPVAVIALLYRPGGDRAAFAPRRDGPLGAIIGGLAIVAWVSWVGPAWSEPWAWVGGLVVAVGLAWHLARTVRRLNAAQIGPREA